MPTTAADDLVLLDWTARLLVKGKRGQTPASVAPILARLSLAPDVWRDGWPGLERFAKPRRGTRATRRQLYFCPSRNRIRGHSRHSTTIDRPRRIQALQAEAASREIGDSGPSAASGPTSPATVAPAGSACALAGADAFLATVDVQERTTKPGPHPSLSGCRCSNNGFLPIPAADDLVLLDWTARLLVNGKRGRPPGPSLRSWRGCRWYRTPGAAW